ncbi:hypothetical protein ACH5RR_016791 [Cinchona calisaya]|uniref:WIYLD domain-containing protein n=1 Tax=Cinchona calisaya TaxID=153742 RepID=A0ABD2ZZM6_9GENT
MAPPRNNRRRKVGLMRIDAALASMRPLGFSDDIVRKSVKDLLNVYGDEGWIFIEEASYKLLIETILEEQQLTEEKGEKVGGGDYAGREICEQSQSVLQLCDKQQEIDDEKRKGKKIQADNYLISKDDTGLALPGSQLDIAPTRPSMIMDRVPTNRIRQPCYGWISDDEADD